MNERYAVVKWPWYLRLSIGLFVLLPLISAVFVVCAFWDGCKAFSNSDWLYDLKITAAAIIVGQFK